MTDALTIHPIDSFQARVRPPGSKSLTNRALLSAALADGPSVIHHPLSAQDTMVMVRALEQLGFKIQWQDCAAKVEGLGGRIPDSNVSLDLQNAGTAMRFLCAACCLGDGEYVLDGNPRMRQRPIGQLVDALARLGGRVDYADGQGFPPLCVRGGGLVGGQIELTTMLSSQYISALLLAGPYCRDGLTIGFEGPVTSRPYVEMTIDVMRRFGIGIIVDPQFSRIRVEPGCYQPHEFRIEPDASSASYFLAAAAIVPESRCTIDGLGKESIQGDIGFADVLHQMGADLIFGSDFVTVIGPPKGQLQAIDLDLNTMPDMAQTLAAVAMFADGPTTMRNIGNLRVKETDRLSAMKAELEKLRATVTIDSGDMTIYPPDKGDIRGATIETYGDHRMAMSLAIIGLVTPGIVIANPDCVNKTFPDFFTLLRSLGMAER